MELASCHPSGTQNLEMASKFLETLWTSEGKTKEQRS